MREPLFSKVQIYNFKGELKLKTSLDVWCTICIYMNNKIYSYLFLFIVALLLLSHNFAGLYVVNFINIIVNQNLFLLGDRMRQDESTSSAGCLR